MASAAEAEIGGLFINGQEASYIRNILREMGHPQDGPTPIVTDNSTAHAFANSTMKIKRSKAMDMRFYWIRDREQQQQIKVFWQKGEDNLADYFTKHHPPAHHQKMRPIYLYEPKISTRPECEGVLNSQARLAPIKVASQPDGSPDVRQAHSSTLARQTDHWLSTPTSLFAVQDTWDSKPFATMQQQHDKSLFRQIRFEH